MDKNLSLLEHKTILRIIFFIFSGIFKKFDPEEPYWPKTPIEMEVCIIHLQRVLKSYLFHKRTVHISIFKRLKQGPHNIKYNIF